MRPAVAKYGFLQLFGSIEEEMFIGTKLRTPLQIFISFQGESEHELIIV